jgi:hypothetical protein
MLGPPSVHFVFGSPNRPYKNQRALSATEVSMRPVCPQAVQPGTPSTHGYSEDCLVSDILLSRRTTFDLASSSSTSMSRTASNLATMYLCSCGYTVADIVWAARTISMYHADRGEYKIAAYPSAILQNI